MIAEKEKFEKANFKQHFETTKNPDAVKELEKEKDSLVKTETAVSTSVYEHLFALRLAMRSWKTSIYDGFYGNSLIFLLYK